MQVNRPMHVRSEKPCRFIVKVTATSLKEGEPPHEIVLGPGDDSCTVWVNNNMVIDQPGLFAERTQKVMVSVELLPDDPLPPPPPLTKAQRVRAFFTRSKSR